LICWENYYNVLLLIPQRIVRIMSNTLDEENIAGWNGIRPVRTLVLIFENLQY